MHTKTLLPLFALLACQPSDGDSSGTAPTTGTTSSTTSSPDALTDAVTIDGLMGHLQALQDAADANGNTRAVGTAGFDASVAYATQTLEDAGYTVRLEPFSITNWQILGPTVLEVPADPGFGFSAGSDFEAMSYSPGGTVTAEVVAVDLVLPPTDDSSSTSGCEASDFNGFPAGSIALIQRGDCFFQDKADNAEAAGAAGVILFNEGQPGRTELEGWQLSDDNTGTIPVVGASFAVGDDLASRLAQGPLTVTLTVDAQVVDEPSVNVIAETATGDADNVLVVGGHLDSVPAGPGINDNGTGVALILELAVQVAANGLEPDNQIRFALWGAEEIGLVGSSAHVQDLGDSGRAQVLANLNFDMIGSPNGSAMIYDGNGDEFGVPGPDGSDVIESTFEAAFDTDDAPFFGTMFDGRSDYFEFILNGIPAGGLFSGAEGTLSQAEADAFGGDAGAPRDACYHRSCDDIDNIDQDLFLSLSRAAASTTWTLANRPSLDAPQARLRTPDLELPKAGCHSKHPARR